MNQVKEIKRYFKDEPLEILRWVPNCWYVKSPSQGVKKIVFTDNIINSSDSDVNWHRLLKILIG